MGASALKFKMHQLNPITFKSSLYCCFILNDFPSSYTLTFGLLLLIQKYNEAVSDAYPSELQSSMNY